MTHDHNDRTESAPAPGEFDDFELPDDIAALLADGDTWEPTAPDLEDSIVAAVMAEVHESAGPAEVASTHGQAHSDGGTVVSLADRAGRWKSAALGAAAALLLVAGLFGVLQLSGGGDSPDFEVALAGTDLAPAATADAEVTTTVDGTRIVLAVDSLPPAEPGTYYEAWLRKDAELGVSAGTFHLRGGGDREIELWSGVTVEDYPLLTVTIQQEGQTESSGRVVLRAMIATP